MSENNGGSQSSPEKGGSINVSENNGDGQSSPVKGGRHTNKVLDKQTKELIYKLYSFMKKEAKEGPILLKQTQKRLSQATGVSCRSIQRVMKESRVTNGQVFSTRKVRSRRRNKTDLDDFDRSVVRESIYQFQLSHVDHLTVDKLIPILNEKMGFKGSAQSLRRILKRMGFQWTKSRNGINQRILYEKPAIREIRLWYLRSLKQYREHHRPIVFTDEIFLHQSDSKSFAWSDGTNPSRTIDQGFMIIHAGYEAGFIANALQIFKMEQKSGDANNDVNTVNYETWVREKLIPNLPAHSVVVFDNASYHNTELNIAPTFSSRKAEMVKWLSNHNIPYTKDLCKPELYKLVKVHKNRFKTYKIDSILAQYGHSVVRLPSHFPDLNPLQMVWATAKEYVVQRNKNLSLIDAIRLFEEGINTISSMDWKLKCDHVREIEYYYLHREKLIDEKNEQLIKPSQLDQSSHSIDSDSNSDSHSSEESESEGNESDSIGDNMFVELSFD